MYLSLNNTLDERHLLKLMTATKQYVIMTLPINPVFLSTSVIWRLHFKVLQSLFFFFCFVCAKPDFTTSPFILTTCLRMVKTARSSAQLPERTGCCAAVTCRPSPREERIAHVLLPTKVLFWLVHHLEWAGRAIAAVLTGTSITTSAAPGTSTPTREQLTLTTLATLG